MTKKEMAEWLAVNVLGWKFDKHGNEGHGCYMENEECVTIEKFWIMGLYNIEEYLYSPDGFFAVWDAVEKELRRQGVTANQYVGFWENYHVKIWNNQDRYEAFYNAVYEAMK